MTAVPVGTTHAAALPIDRLLSEAWVQSQVFIVAITRGALGATKPGPQKPGRDMLVAVFIAKGVPHE